MVDQLIASDRTYRPRNRVREAAPSWMSICSTRFTSASRSARRVLVTCLAKMAEDLTNYYHRPRHTSSLPACRYRKIERVRYPRPAPRRVRRAGRSQPAARRARPAKVSDLGRDSAEHQARKAICVLPARSSRPPAAPPAISTATSSCMRTSSPSRWSRQSARPTAGAPAGHLQWHTASRPHQ